MPGRKVLLRSLGALLLAATATGCSEESEIGKPCQLVKAPTPEDAATGARFSPVLYGELVPGQDFISFGATGCVDLICVSDKDAYRGTTEEQGSPAFGYCSDACIPGSDSCSNVAGDAVEGLEARISCRSLLLDQETLDRLRQEDPDAYRRTFGENVSPFFCAGNPPAAEETGS
jgi:hypothetical protein